MNTLWVILNEDKSAVVEVFETADADSARHWDKFFAHSAGNVFCRRKASSYSTNVTWYVNYHYWEDITRWGFGPPKGMSWSACLAIPEALKMLEFLE